MLLKLKIKLQNIGDSVWLNRVNVKGGWVSIALYQKRAFTGAMREAANRCHLSEDVLPGKDLTADISFMLPEDHGRDPWYLDLVNEQYFWFPSRGTDPVKIIVK